MSSDKVISKETSCTHPKNLKAVATTGHGMCFGPILNTVHS